MAEKRSKKQEVRSKKSAADFRKMSVDELQKALVADQKDLLELQKSLKANELANPHAVKKIRREIARIKTIICEVNRENVVKNTTEDSNDEKGVK